MLRGAWKLCPKVATFYTTFPLSSSPSHSHPVHTLVVDHRRQLEQVGPLPEGPNLRRAIILYPGGFPRRDDSDALFAAPRRGIRLEDVENFAPKELREKRNREPPRLVPI
jgi:hypothetical protein